MKTKQRDVKERPDTFHFSSQNYVNLRASFLLRAENQRASLGQMAAPRQHRVRLTPASFPYAGVHRYTLPGHLFL